MTAFPIGYFEDAEQMFEALPLEFQSDAQALVMALDPLTPAEIQDELVPTKFDNVFLGQNRVRHDISLGWQNYDTISGTVIVVFAWGPPPDPPGGLWILGTFMEDDARYRDLKLSNDFTQRARRAKRTPL